ncbi:MAG: sel1 repeat family protein [Hyphomicrobiales bacterium]|nr:sel1 repeat family protein [Hyphomicrobiales bacterium]
MKNDKSGMKRVCGIGLLIFCVQFSSSAVFAQKIKTKTIQPEAAQEISEELINSRINGTLENTLEQPVVDKDKNDKFASKSDTGKPDLAYGAYQRGYYLTAFNHALPRAKLGDPAAQLLIGVLYEKGLGIKQNRKEAAHWYKFAAENGSKEAQFSYALKLLEGVHVTKDKKTARELLKKAADAGHSVAQFNYAQMIVDERPTSQGIKLALSYYEKAAASGVANAYLAIAQILTRGYGTVTPNEKTARDMLIKGALNNVENAQIKLAIWLANGRGGEKDLDGALAWFRIAALRGNVIAQNRLARMYALGIGGKVRPDEAAKWYVLSRRQGHRDSMLDDFYNSLTADVRNAALKAANSWKPRTKPKWQLSKVLAKK